jgi:hypothetical protein
MRWFLLATGIFVASVYIYLLVAELVSLFGSQRTTDLNIYDVFLFAMLWPKCLLGFGIGGWSIAWAIRDWNGNVNRVLLLHLVETQQKQTISDAKVS